MFRKSSCRWSKKLQGREGSPCSAEQVDLSMFHEPSWKQVYAGRCSEEATLNEQAVQRRGVRESSPFGSDLKSDDRKYPISKIES